jgi:hypothetical protein
LEIRRKKKEHVQALRLVKAFSDSLWSSPTIERLGELNRTIDRLEQLESSDRVYEIIKQQFDNEWRHPGKTGSFKSIYLDNRYTTDVTNGISLKKRLLYHGTQRACSIGDPKSPLVVCHSNECCLCSILREGFKLARAGE